MPDKRLGQWLDSMGIPGTAAMHERLAEFEEALYTANSVMNLTRVPREEFTLRHVVDCLLLSEFVPTKASVLDIGTGAGFPAWPLALFRPDLAVTALDSSGKATGFLARVPLPNLKVVRDRAESWGVRERFDVVTGRAVAPLGIQLELSAPACKVGGLVLPMRSAADGESIRAFDAGKLGLALENLGERSWPVDLDGEPVVRLFPVFRKISTTPDRYPRPWADMRRKPLK